MDKAAQAVILRESFPGEGSSALKEKNHLPPVSQGNNPFRLSKSVYKKEEEPGRGWWSVESGIKKG